MIMLCRSCGSQLPEGALFCTSCGNRVEAAPTAAQGMNFDFNSTPVRPPPPSPGMNFDVNTNTATAVRTDKPKFYEYKVLTQKDKWFSGKFDPAVLEQALNAYAQQGWRVIGCATADIPGFGVTRQEFVTLMERER